MINSFFNISDFNRDDIIKIINNNFSNEIPNLNIGLIFEKPSTRTRLSFTIGIKELKANPIDLRFNELNISRDESFEDTIRAFECYLDGLIYRTTSHQRLLDAKKFFHKPIINALSDQSHPCQALSDFFTLKEFFGKIELNILWMGDMNNVCFSHVELANLLPEINLYICCPDEISSKIDWNLNSNISVFNSLDEIDLSKINCVMTDVFISMNDDDSNLKIELLKPYSVTSELMFKTSPNSVFMHCLPAKIGHEVSEDVIRGPKSIVWRQAYNRMVAQKKLLQFIYQ